MITGMVSVEITSLAGTKDQDHQHLARQVVSISVIGKVGGRTSDVDGEHRGEKRKCSPSQIGVT